MRRAIVTLLLAATGVGAHAASAPAQDVLDRPANLGGPGVGIPWTLHVLLPHRFRDAEPGAGIDLGRTATFTGALGLPWRTAAGAAYAIQSPTAPGEPDEVELFARHRLLDGDRAPLDASVTAAWNVASRSVDAEGLIARQLGPLRVLAATRWFSDWRGLGTDRLALAGGAVWHPFPRSAPVAFAADISTLVDRTEAEEPAWSAGVQVGIPHTALTLSIHATNTAATTLQGSTLGQDRILLGVEAVTSIPAGYLLGLYPPRERAVEGVSEVEDGAADAVVEIRRYAYGPARVVVRAGQTVEWVNRDAVVHTATAEDGAWDSGAIPAGQAWRARFERPGVYPYYCGPHPFMKGVVIVR